MAKKKISKKELALRLALLTGHIGECICRSSLGDGTYRLCGTCASLGCGTFRYCNLDQEEWWREGFMNGISLRKS